MRAASRTAAAAIETLAAPISVVRAHFLRHRERALEQLVQQRAERAGRLGRAHRLLHLAEDLRLAQHHRVEAGGDAERVAHRLLAAAGCRGSGRSSVGLEAVIAREPVGAARRRARSPAT